MTNDKMGNLAMKTAKKIQRTMGRYWSKTEMHPAIISTKKFSLGYLKELSEKYYMNGFFEYQYCCQGEDFNCWVEVELLDAGWFWLDTPKKELPQKLFEIATDFTKEERKFLYGKKIFIIENDREIEILIPMRANHFFHGTRGRRDLLLVFSKTKGETIDYL